MLICACFEFDSAIYFNCVARATLRFCPVFVFSLCHRSQLIPGNWYSRNLSLLKKLEIILCSFLSAEVKKLAYGKKKNQFLN